MHIVTWRTNDKARVKGAHFYEFIVRSQIIIPIQHFRQWTVPHHSAQTVTAGLVIDLASSYIFLLVGRSMTIKNMGMGSLNIIHSNHHMTSVNQPMTNVWMNQLPMTSVANYSKERQWTTMKWALVAQLATTPTKPVMILIINHLITTVSAVIIMILNPNQVLLYQRFKSSSTI